MLLSNVLVSSASTYKCACVTVGKCVRDYVPLCVCMCVLQVPWKVELRKYGLHCVCICHISMAFLEFRFDTFLGFH